MSSARYILAATDIVMSDQPSREDQLAMKAILRAIFLGLLLTDPPRLLLGVLYSMLFRNQQIRPSTYIQQIVCLDLHAFIFLACCVIQCGERFTVSSYHTLQRISLSVLGLTGILLLWDIAFVNDFLHSQAVLPLQVGTIVVLIACVICSVLGFLTVFRAKETYTRYMSISGV